MPLDDSSIKTLSKFLDFASDSLISALGAEISPR
jgi:hypothetical protein